MIGLVGASDQDELNRISDALDADSYVFIDTRELPGEDTMTLEVPDDDTGIDAYYVQSTNSSAITVMPWEDSSDEDVNLRSLYRNYEKDGFLKGYLMNEQARGKLVVNDPIASELHHYKPYQIEQLATNDIPVPATCITNSAERAERFFDEHGEVVVKPVGGAGHAGLQTKADFEAHKQSLHRSPVVFQEYLPGDDIRAYVLGGEFLCAYTVESDDDVVDYRGSESGYSLLEDVGDVDSFSERAAACFEYDFCAVDLKASPDGPVVLDCSPRAGFAAIEEALQTRRISASVATFLERHDGSADAD